MPMAKKKTAKGRSVISLPKQRELFKAICSNDATAIANLLKKNLVDINGVDPDDDLGRTPLLAACELQALDVVDVLVTCRSQSVDVNSQDKRGKRAIWWAAHFGDDELAEMLILDSRGKKCDCNYIDKESGCTPLYRAILSKNPELCRLLVRGGADVNLRRLGLQGECAKAETPLMKAVQLGELQICDLLLNSMCDLHAKTSDGLSALHFAVAYRRHKIAELLLHNKAKKHSASNHGITPLTIAIEQYQPAMVRLLIEFGYNMSKPFTWGESPLEMAIRVHSQACAMMLIFWGCPVTREKDKPSYFKMAAEEGLTKLIKFMLEVNPFFANEVWVREKLIPKALYRYPSLCQRLHESSQCASSLQLLCRRKIVKYLGRYPPSKLKKLPLPPKLIQLFEMRHHFAHDVFVPQTLEDPECPFQCEIECNNPQCLPIDLSSEDEDV